MAEAVEVFRQVGQTLIDPGLLVDVMVVVDQVFQFVSHHALIQVGPGGIGAEAVLPVVAVDEDHVPVEELV